MATPSPSEESEKVKKALKEVSEIVNVIDEGFRELTSRLTDVVDEIKEGSNELTSFNNVTKDINRSLRSMSKVNEDLIKNQIKLNQGKLSSKQIDEQINKAVATRQILTGRLESLQRKITENGEITIKQQTEIESLQSSIAEISEEVFDNFKKQREEAEKLEEAIKLADKRLGIFGGVLKGIGKIPIIGDLVDTKEALEVARNTTEKTNSGLKGLKAGLSNLGTQFKESITNPANLALFAITQFGLALKASDKATGDLAKDFNITYNEAANLREELIQIGNLSGNIALNARALQESMVAVGKALGSNAMLNKEDLETFTELREMAGYTNEELIGIQKLTLATGGSLKDNTKQFLGTVSALNAQNKLTINEKQLLKEVSNTSAAIKLSVGGTAKGLAEAAFKAKEFGINLDQADKISESLLDFESSISNELSAELITGKNLNLEKARLLALNGDIAGASAEILKQVGGTAEFTKMNRIQQESLAKAVGLSREELAASLIEREALNKLGVKDAAAAKAKFDLLVKEKGYTAAVAEMGNDQYATQLKQQSIQERFNKSVEKLKEIFIGIAEPVLQIVSPLADLITTILPAINLLLAPLIEGFSYIGKLVGLISEGISSFSGWLAEGSAAATALKIVLAPIAALVGIIAAGMIYASLAAIPIVGPALAAVAVVGMIGLLAKAGAAAIGIKDGMIGPDGGLIVSGPKGTYSLDKNDTIVAGTNIGKRNNVSTQQQDLSPLLAEIKALRQEQARANSKPTVIENSVNGTRFGTAVAMNTYKVQ